MQPQGLLGEAIPFDMDVRSIPEAAPGSLVGVPQIGEPGLLRQGGPGRPSRIGDVPIFRGVEADDLLQSVLPSLPGGESELFGDQAHIVLHLPFPLQRLAVAEQGMAGLHVDSHFRGNCLDFQVDRPFRFAHRDGGQVR